MATITAPKAQTTVVTSTGCCTSTTQTEQVTRAICYLRLEEQVETKLLLLNERRAVEQEKIFTALCGATDLAKLSELWKAYDTATVALDIEVAQVTRLQVILKERTSAFVKTSTESFRIALEKQRCTLTELHSKETQDTISVQTRIAAIDLRLKEIGATKGAALEQRIAKKKA
jgi:hypothetical protein